MEPELQDIERPLEGEAEPAKEYPPDQSLTLDNVRQKINIPNEVLEGYQRLVLAGSKVLFDKETHDLALQSLSQGDAPIPMKLGRGIASLVLMLFEKSKGAIPPEVLIPAGVDLLMQAVDYLRASGEFKIKDSGVADALLEMVGNMAKGAGIDPVQLLNQLGAVDEELDQAAPEAEEAGPEAPAAPAPRGLIEQEMQQ